MNISADEIKPFIFIARKVASYTPVASVLCPALDIIGVVVGIQEEEARKQWEHSINDSLNTITISVVALQSTTAVIGLGTVAGAVLSAVNVYETFKLRQDVKELKLAVTAGFIDLEAALKDKGDEILIHIENVKKDVEYSHHRTLIEIAYGDFIHAVDWLRNTVKLTDQRNLIAAITGVQGMLIKSLAVYNNPQIYKHTSAAAKLRRLECAWAIDQTITMTYQIQSQLEVVSNRLSDLQKKIRHDILNIIKMCKSQEELDFLFPEIARIQNHDLNLLECWKNMVDWTRRVSPEDFKQFISANFNNPEFSINK